MSEIIVKKLSVEELDAMGVSNWPIWEKEASSFPWSYSEKESCLILAGKVTVTPEGCTPVSFGAGDFVVFPAGMSCTWNIIEDVRKHYKFG
jgi:uncharacterized cupin superfamily protein